MPGQDDSIDPELQDMLNQLDSAPTQPLPVIQEQPKPEPAVAPVSTETPVETKPPSEGPDLSPLLKKFDNLADKLLSNLDADRTKIQEYIDLYAQNVSGEAPKASFIEGLVQLLVAKSGISTNAPKLLDSLTKLIAATKSLTPQGQAVSAPTDELDKLLAEDFDPTAP